MSAVRVIGESPSRGRPGFNGLSPTEWAQSSRNVWNDVSSTRGARQLLHGAVFPQKLAERVIRLMSKPGGLVLDPFIGIGTTAVAAAAAGRKCVGIELSAEFAREARAWLKETGTSGQRIIRGDARNMARWVLPQSVDLTLTSPPYADFIHRSLKDRATTHKTSLIRHANNSRVRVYSKSRSDLGNLAYSSYLESIRLVMAEVFEATCPGGYAVWVVKDHRDTAKGIPYVPVHVDIASAGISVGFKWHDLIVWDQNDQRSLVLLGYPTVFYTNQNCSFLVVLRKGKV